MKLVKVLFEGVTFSMPFRIDFFGQGGTLAFERDGL